jgi:iron complex transport system substrate-binding protein
MRVVTLVPAATEIVAALGDLRLLVGVSHECDYPASVTRLPRVTTTPVDPTASSAAIDAEVRQLSHAGLPVIAIEADLLRRLGPDLIITQSLCEVCAASNGEVHRLASVLSPPPRVLSLTARDLNGIWQDIGAVGASLDLQEEAEELVLGLRSRLSRLRLTVLVPAPRVVCVEWLDPPYLAGHWVPDLVDAAGGRDVGAQSGRHSARSDWAELARLRPDCIVVMLCGFGLDRSRLELERVSDPEALRLFSEVPTWILDGNAYTSRPGPRVVDGAIRIQTALKGQTATGLERWQPAGVC